jgi:nitrogen fixation protein FixH
MFFISTNDPSFSVEPNYYEKAVRWDQERTQARRGAALGYQITASVDDPTPNPLGARLVVTVRAGEAALQPGAQVTATVFHNARAADRQQLTLGEAQPGVYEAHFHVHKAGRWEARVSVLHGGNVLTTVHELELLASAVVQKPSSRPGVVQ